MIFLEVFTLLGDGSDFNSVGAEIAVKVDGTPGSNNMPGRIVFKTTASGASTSTERLRITSDGKVRVPDNGKFVAGAGDDLEIYHDGSNSFVKDTGTGALKLATSELQITNAAVDELLVRATQNGSVELFYDNSKKLETTTNGIQITGQIDIGTTSIYGTGDISMGDSDQLRLGGGDDLRIYHDGSINRIRSDVLTVIEKNDSEDMASFMPDGAVVLFHNGNQRFETTSTGASVTGNLNVSGHVYLNDDREVVIGAGQDLKLYHDSATGDSFIKETGSGNLKLVTSTFRVRNAADTEHIIWANQDAEVRLYHNNEKKLETTTTGAKITGALEVTQEYPSIRPILDLNFAATKTLDRRITFSRRGIATYTAENGLIKYAAINEPRFDHDPITGESLGLLIEEGRTNLAEYGTIVGDTGWYNRPTFTTTLNDSISPDGTQNATKITSLNAESDADLYSFEQYSIGSNKTITHSIYIKSPDTANVGKEIHFRGKRIGGTTSSWSQKFILTAEWQRVTVTHTYQSDNNTGRAYIGSDPNSSHPAGEATACLFWGLQVEEGSFATSFIPTYGSTVTRENEFVTIKGTNFTDFYNQNEGTFFIDSAVARGSGYNTYVGSVTSSTANGGPSYNFNALMSDNDNSDILLNIWDGTGGAQAMIAIAHPSGNMKALEHLKIMILQFQ